MRFFFFFGKEVSDLVCGSWWTASLDWNLLLCSDKDVNCTGRSSCPACLSTWQESPLEKKVTFLYLSLLLEKMDASFSLLLLFAIATALESAVSFSTFWGRTENLPQIVCPLLREIMWSKLAPWTFNKSPSIQTVNDWRFSKLTIC